MIRFGHFGAGNTEAIHVLVYDRPLRYVFEDSLAMPWKEMHTEATRRRCLKGLVSEEENSCTSRKEEINDDGTA